MATIDLHMHSVISIDGELEPEEVIRRAASRGIRAAALTDHNSVRGVSRALEEAVRLGIRLAKGVELDCRLGLTATAGSDFHGRSKPSLMPGDTGCEPAEEQAVLEAAEAAGIFGGHGGGR